VADENGTREKIISLALELFAQNGFSATSMRQIAKTVGIRESSIYNHFASKDEILEAVLSAHGFGFVKNILEKKVSGSRN
jgi:Transcriptional regulator